VIHLVLRMAIVHSRLAECRRAIAAHLSAIILENVIGRLTADRLGSDTDHHSAESVWLHLVGRETAEHN
jgi:hypothetical protein